MRLPRYRHRSAVDTVYCRAHWNRLRLAGRAIRWPFLSLTRNFMERLGNPYAAPDDRDWPNNYRRFGLFRWIAVALAPGTAHNWQSGSEQIARQNPH
jgi:hypothetical protein